MRVKGIVWLGTRTERFDEMREFFLEITGIARETTPVWPSLTWPAETGSRSWTQPSPRATWLHRWSGSSSTMSEPPEQSSSRAGSSSSARFRPVPARPGHTSAPRTGTCTSSPSYPLTPQTRRSAVRSERGRTELCFGEHLRRRSRRRDSRMHLGGALEAFESCGATPWAERARTELEHRV
jgi:hypothetical protein